MLIFWRLILGHFLVDFTFQSNALNAWKRKSLWGMLVHCGMHPVAYAVLAFPYLNDYWVDTSWLQMRGWVCVPVLFLLHFLEDEWRVFSIFQFKTPDNTAYFLLDQVIHYLAMIPFVPIGLSDVSQGWFPEKWPVMILLFVGVTHFTTVLVYFLEQDIYGERFPGFDEKYIEMSMRAVLALCFLLPGYWWIGLAAAWAAAMAYLRRRRVFEFSWFNLGTGGALAAVLGLAARFLYYS